MGAAIQVVALYDVPIKDALGEAVEGEEVALILVAGETFEEVVLEAWYGPVWIWRLWIDGDRDGDRNGERYIRVYCMCVHNAKTKAPSTM